MKYISKRVNSANMPDEQYYSYLRKALNKQSFVLGDDESSSTIKEIVQSIKVSRDFEELLEAISGCEDDTLDTLLQDTYEEYRDNYNFRDCKAELLSVIKEYSGI